MATIKKFEDIEAWQLARELAKETFEIVSVPPFKDFRFRNQITDSIGSVMDNIAEGFDRDGRNEFIQFMCSAKGSGGEHRSQLYRAFDFGYISEETFERMTKKNVKMCDKIGAFNEYLKKTPLRGSKFNRN